MEAFQQKTKRECIVLALKTKLPNVINSNFQVVSIDNPVKDLEFWMRHDRHGTTFDSGCTIIFTNFENVNKAIERKFNNLLWVVLDKVPKGKKIEMEWPVVEILPNIAVRCPYAKTKKVSFYDR